MQRIAILLAGLLVCELATAKLRVVACEPEWAQLARDIGGTQAEVLSATTAQQDVHHIQARPSLIAKLRRADLLVCSGAGLEAGWLPVLLRRANNPAVQPGRPGYLEMGRHVALRDVRATADRAEGDVHPEGNPHFQVDPRIYVGLAGVLGERMVQIDPQNAAAYRERVEAFQTRWKALLPAWQAQAAPLAGRRVVVHHLDWSYLLDWLGLEQAAMLEPKPGVPPSAGHLAKVLDTLASQPPACVIRTVYQPEKPSAWLARRLTINSVVIPHTVGASDAAASLPQLFDDILKRLLEDCRE